MTDDLLNNFVLVLRQSQGEASVRCLESLPLADAIEALTAERDQAWKMVAEADTRLGQALGDALQDKADNARLRADMRHIMTYVAEPSDLDGDTINALRADLRFVGRVARAALLQYGDEKASAEKAEADNARLRAALNQSRLAFAGYVSVQSAIDLLDRAALKGESRE